MELRSTFFKRALDTSDVAREEKLKIGSNFRKSMDIVSVNNYCHRYRPFINSGRMLGNFDAVSSNWISMKGTLVAWK